MNAAILLSRQRLFPSRNLSWIQKVCEVMAFIKKENMTILTSVGTQTWELLIVAAKIELIKQKIFIIADSINEFENKKKYYEYQFNLDSDCFIQPIICSDNTKNNDILKNRDSVIIDSADALIPVSIRKNGNMSEMLLKADQKKIISAFTISYKDEKSRNIDLNTSKRDFKKNIDLEEYIIHWTRQSKNKWPDEKLYDYYFDILQSDTYPRNAFNTIMHILDIKRIISSSRHLSKNCKCVSFSGAKIYDFEKLMRWRKRYTEMSFEPYGIGIEKKYALLNGITKVKYLPLRELKNIGIFEKWKYQSTGEKADWLLEDEYRSNGDVDISLIPPHKLICICPYKNEALMIRKKYDIFAYSIYED